MHFLLLPPFPIPARKRKEEKEEDEELIQGVLLSRCMAEAFIGKWKKQGHVVSDYLQVIYTKFVTQRV